MLVYHGRSREMCEWVLKQYEHCPLSKNNLTTQLWIQACKEFLQSLGDSPSR